MKLLAALAIAAALLIIPAALSALNGPGIIRIESAPTRVVHIHGRTVTISTLYNRSITSRAIGSGIFSCVFIGRGGSLGRGTSLCQAVYSLPHGRIAAVGLVKIHSYYLLAVTGGTGLYSNVGGEVVSTTIVPGQDRLLFSLEI